MTTQPPVTWTSDWSTAVIKLHREPIGPHGQTRLARLTLKACQLNDARELKEFFRATVSTGGGRVMHLPKPESSDDLPDDVLVRKLRDYYDQF
jgi:hypothetical protein